MKIDHVGFLWQLSDEETLAATARRLAEDPDAKQASDEWVAALNPLELLHDPTAPPAGLAERTLARVAGLKPRPVRLPGETPVPRSWWRSRADIAVAFAMLVVLCGLG